MRSDGRKKRFGGIGLTEIEELMQKADWKTEKHVPVIEIAGVPGKDWPVKVSVTVGKQVQHPNTTAHHIAWIQLFFLPEGAKFPIALARSELQSHGAGAEGPDTSTVYAQPELTCAFRTAKPGTVMAVSMCNIHGLWTSSSPLKAA
jgi:superoxide reductase